LESLGFCFLDLADLMLCSESRGQVSSSRATEGFLSYMQWYPDCRSRNYYSPLDFLLDFSQSLAQFLSNKRLKYDSFLNFSPIFSFLSSAVYPVGVTTYWCYLLWAVYFLSVNLDCVIVTHNWVFRCILIKFLSNTRKLWGLIATLSACQFSACCH